MRKREKPGHPPEGSFGRLTAPRVETGHHPTKTNFGISTTFLPAMVT
ncbi:MAG: hypothetical protein WAM78_14440 [Candidatus Sulfotelmatobacter sp.]